MIRLPVAPSITPAETSSQSDPGLSLYRRAPQTVQTPRRALPELACHCSVLAGLGLTQSGDSQAVKRLRGIFGDALFLRRPHGMEPTTVALALEPAIATAVEALQGALGAVRQFDPATARA
jgi:hypothetical protein